MDRVIGYLQSFLERKVPIVPYARLSGEDGMRLSRAAFAVMIKFSEYFEDFSNLIDEVDISWSDLEADEERELKIKEVIKAALHYEQIIKRWESASKMRQWISEKKKNLIEKVKKEVEVEYSKKKEEDKKKREEVEAKLKEEADKKKAEEEKAGVSSEVPIAAVVEEEKKAEPEIVQIDTTTKAAINEDEKKEEGEKAAEEDGQGFTEADKQAIDDLADVKYNAELQKIYEKIVEKAEFLVKLQVPGVYLVKDPSKKKEGPLLMIKDHHS